MRERERERERERGRERGSKIHKIVYRTAGGPTTARDCVQLWPPVVGGST